jgi:hypothetical protein
MTDIETLKGAYFAGEADAVSVARLGRWLVESSDNAREFSLEAMIVRELRGRAATDDGTRPAQVVPLRVVGQAALPSSVVGGFLAEARTRLVTPWRLAAAAAACILIAASVALVMGRHTPARVVAELAAVWEGVAPTSGGLTPGRVYRLESGLTQVETSTGAMLVIEGPCELAVTGENATLFNRGRLTARCSTKQTHGFTVTTPTGRVVDLGTEFGVEHGERGTFAYVFDGEVQAFSDSGRYENGRVIRSGEGVRLSPGGAEPIGEGGWSPEFVTVSDFRVAVAEANGSVAAGWSDHYERLRSDPELVFWTDFDACEQLGHPTNLCRYGDGRHKLLTTSGLTFEAGRLATNDAVRLSKGSTLPVIRVPGVFRSLTLAAWIRLEGDNVGRESEHRGLLLSDWSLPGSLHWQLKGDTLRLSHPRSGTQPHVSYSAPLPESFFDESAWRLLVTVVDAGPAGEVRHYLDGALLAKTRFAADTAALRLGDCEVGGWSRADDQRLLDGAIDDLMVWRRHLTEPEIKQLHEDGQPPPSQPPKTL